MAKREDFTSDQWQLLIDVPSLVGAAVMVAGKSGIGSVLEALALSRNTLKADEPFSKNELVQAVVQGRVQDKDRAAVEKLSGPYRGLQPDEMLAEAELLCGKLSSLLSEKTTSAEGRQYKQWVYQVAVKVAEAAKEGDFLGFGGQRVSEGEEEALRQIATALAIEEA